MRCHVYAATDVGCVRKHNEDALCVGTTAVFGTPAWQSSFALEGDMPILVAVVDGMGGHRGGADASRIVVKHLAATPAQSPTSEKAADLMNAINTELFNTSNQNADLCGMGATIAMLWMDASGGLCINVGDAKVFREQDGFLQLRSEDQVIQSATGSRVLFQALGGTTSLQSITAAIRSEPMRAGRRFLLCSDGLTDEVDMDTMEELMKQPNEKAVQALIESARVAGGHDNITIAIVEIMENDV